MAADHRSGTHATGYYDDELVRGDDGWRIARRRFTMVTMQRDVANLLAGG
jgi:hypothetical protein